MKKLKIILNHNLFYFILLTTALLYGIYINSFVNKTSLYNNLENIVFTITSITKKDYGYQLHIKNKETIHANYYTNKLSLNLGDKIKIKYKSIQLKNKTLENTFNYKNYLYNNNIFHYIEIKEITLIEKNKNFLYNLKSTIINRLSKTKLSEAYIKSLLFGSTSLIDENTMNTYKNNGTIHLFAISGIHISIFISILNYILLKLKIKNNISFIIISLLLILYIFIVDWKISVLRASTFWFFLKINSHFKLSISKTNILIFLFSLFILINPFLIYSSSFWLSFLITFYLILFNKKIKTKKNILKLLYISLISFLISFPIIINSYYEINFLSIINNIIFIPYVSIVIIPLSIITYVFPILDSVLYLFISILEKMSMICNEITIFKFIFKEISLTMVIVYYLLITLLLYKNKYIYLIPIFIFLYNAKINENYVIFIDVDQGDCIFINVDNTYTLIDTGYKSATSLILPYLKSQGIKHIDNLILTHGDYDHMAEAITIVNNFKTKKVILNNDSFNDLEKSLIEVLNKKNIEYYQNIKSLNINNYKLIFLNTGIYNNENDNSNVIYFNYNNIKFLFMGDAGIEREKNILENYNIERIDFLKVGHHGSNTSSSKCFIEKIKPQNCLISVGANNRYNHPNESVIKILNDHCNIYRTDIDANIKIILNKNKYKIETE